MLIVLHRQNMSLHLTPLQYSLILSYLYRKWHSPCGVLGSPNTSFNIHTVSIQRVAMPRYTSNSVKLNFPISRSGLNLPGSCYGSLYSRCMHPPLFHHSSRFCNKQDEIRTFPVWRQGFFFPSFYQHFYLQAVFYEL